LDYEEDLDKARRVVVEAVRQVEHVLPEQPVEALFLDFGESAVVFRVRWWIDSYVDTFLMYDKVNNAILEALRAADIPVAFPRQDFKFKIDADDAGRLSSSFDEKRNG
jgi:small-conductance mechanosensitive channel